MSSAEAPASKTHGATTVASSPEGSASPLDGASPLESVTQPEPLAPGVNLGRYVVLHMLGSGGMGVVYAAYDPELDRKVAIKLLRTGDADSNPAPGHHTHARARLLREAQALAKLSHPNVVPVFDVGTFGERVFIAMAFIDGFTLSEWLARHQLSWRQTVALYAEAGKGLAAAHAEGLIHRDFKPHNVLVGKDGAVRVLDFGLVRRDQESSDDVVSATDASVQTSSVRNALTENLTLQGSVMGTPSYMAPEQHLSKPVDASADQYAFCAALYEGLYGSPPFDPHPHSQLLARKQSLQLQALPKAAETRVPRWLRKVVLRGLDPEPARRWPSMKALLRALGRDPKKTAVRVTVASVAMAAALVGGWAYAQFGAQRLALCSGAEAQLREAWNPTIRESVHRAFTQTRLGYADETWKRVSGTLDEYAMQWGNEYRDACEATHVRHEQAVSIMDLRMACLAGELHELRATTSVLANADAQVLQNAVSAVSALRPVADCGKADWLQAGPAPPPEPVRAAVDTAHARNAEVKALNRAGKFPDALPLAENALGIAQATDYAPVIAEALLNLGSLQHQVRRLPEAKESLQRASWLAKSVRADDTAAQAMVLLVGVLGGDIGDLQGSLRWARHAEATSQRLGPETYHDELRENILAYVHLRNGMFEEALEHGQRSLAHAARVLAPNDEVIGITHSSMASAAASLGQIDLALEHFLAALENAETVRGDHHPSVGSTLVNIGIIHSMLGDHAEAQRLMGRGLSIIEGSIGTDNYVAAQVLASLGDTLFAQGKTDEAVATYRRAFDAFVAVAGKQDPQVLSCLRQMATALIAAKRLDEAEAVLAEAAVLRANGSTPNPQVEVDWTLLGAKLESARGGHAAAIRTLQKALAELESRPPDDSPNIALRLSVLLELARIHFADNHVDTAIATYERALELPDLVPELRAQAHFELAKAHAGESPSRTVADVGEARTHLRQPASVQDPGAPVATSDRTCTHAEQAAADQVRTHAEQAAADYAAAGKAFADEREQVLEWLASRSG